MIAVLNFGAPERQRDGRLLRRASFVMRSTLPRSAACLIANGVREQLSRLVALDLDVEVIEPSVPAPQARRILLEEATAFRVRGRICDGFIIVRGRDARRLAALAFGEDERSEAAPLSEIERATLERIVLALVPLCNSLCGTLGPIVRETHERVACDLESYFEIRTRGALGVAIGFGLTRDPNEEVVAGLTLDDLAEVEIEGTVEVGRGILGIQAFSRLSAGATVMLDTPLAAPGILRFGTVAFARGTCGVRNGRSAISFDGDLASEVA